MPLKAYKLSIVFRRRNPLISTTPQHCNFLIYKYQTMKRSENGCISNEKRDMELEEMYPRNRFQTMEDFFLIINHLTVQLNNRNDSYKSLNVD